MQVLKVKAISDAHVQQSGLDFTIVRSGGLSNQPGSGQITLGQTPVGEAVAPLSVSS